MNTNINLNNNTSELSWWCSRIELLNNMFIMFGVTALFQKKKESLLKIRILSADLTHWQQIPFLRKPSYLSRLARWKQQSDFQDLSGFLGLAYQSFTFMMTGFGLHQCTRVSPPLVLYVSPCFLTVVYLKTQRFRSDLVFGFDSFLLWF